MNKIVTCSKQYLFHENIQAQVPITLQWSHNKRGGVSNHRRLNCVLNRLFRAQIQENIKITDGFHSQRASNAKKNPFDDVIMNIYTEYVSIPRRLFILQPTQTYRWLSARL